MLSTSWHMADLRVYRSMWSSPIGKVPTTVIRVLVALELRSYREAIAKALQYQHPQAQVHTTDPEVFDLEMMHLEPHVVICSQTTPIVRDGALCWVKILIVGEELRAVVSVGRKCKIVTNITLGELVSVLEEAEALVHEAGGH
jgi:hypothetical protein